ncbi:hypothetical protein TRIP_B50559 [uncultured Desulfatiglans sp.]|uniref:Uncharacterized protein n=1 Tax=Uncultured Desulfatiglans sp. TaxID=1748965 RepID=A0A653AI57_UNCDX|nr:hypothetical protein TRIP_B50559 [uncultured Desulfatiglans sp.]
MPHPGKAGLSSEGAAVQRGSEDTLRNRRRAGCPQPLDAGAKRLQEYSCFDQWTSRLKEVNHASHYEGNLPGAKSRRRA